MRRRDLFHAGRPATSQGRRSWLDGLRLYFSLIELGRWWFVADVGPSISYGLFRQAQIGAGQVFESRPDFWVGFGFGFREKLSGPEEVGVPRGQFDPLCRFTHSPLCNAVFGKSFQDEAGKSAIWIKNTVLAEIGHSQVRNRPAIKTRKEHIANREQIVYIAFLQSIPAVRRARVVGGSNPGHKELNYESACTASR
jgi:hypothetical protein